MTLLKHRSKMPSNFERGDENLKSRKRRREDYVKRQGQEKKEETRFSQKSERQRVRRNLFFPFEWNLPQLALEKVFSNLTWKDLARAMLVCKDWREVAGQPSLWTRFPLKLCKSKLKRFARIRRLRWVKSVKVDLYSIRDLKRGIAVIQDVLNSWPRAEELQITSVMIPRTIVEEILTIMVQMISYFEAGNKIYQDTDFTIRTNNKFRQNRWPIRIYPNEDPSRLFQLIALHRFGLI